MVKSSFSVLPLLAVFLIAAALVWLIRRRLGAKPQDTPACGKCGYCVRGLPTFTCPECGADLREVGIVAAATRKPLGPFAYILAWSFFLFCAATILKYPILGTIAPRVHSVLYSRVVFCQWPDFRETIKVEMKDEALAWPWSQPKLGLGKMKLVLISHPGLDIQVDLSTKGYEYTDANGQLVQKTSGFGEQALLDWLAAAGIDTTKQNVKGAAKGILQAAYETPQAQGKFTKLAPDPEHNIPRINAHPTYAPSNSRIPSWFPVCLMSAWGLVWIVGVWLIVRRHRRRTAAAET